MREINKIIIHCSDSDYGHHDNIEVIRYWHKKRGWKDVGYHYVILKSGEIKVGRPLHMQGAHCKGQNRNSIGICLTGKNTFSSEQFIALGIICKELCDQFGLEYTDIYPHNYYDNGKTCPNFTMNLFDKPTS